MWLTLKCVYFSVAMAPSPRLRCNIERELLCAPSSNTVRSAQAIVYVVPLQGREEEIMATIREARRRLAADLPNISVGDVFGCTAATVRSPHTNTHFPGCMHLLCTLYACVT